MRHLPPYKTGTCSKPLNLKPIYMHTNIDDQTCVGVVQSAISRFKPRLPDPFKTLTPPDLGQQETRLCARFGWYR